MFIYIFIIKRKLLNIFEMRVLMSSLTIIKTVDIN